MRYTMRDYRAAISEMGMCDIGSSAFKLAQMKANSIAAAMLQKGSFDMAREIVNDLTSQLDCGIDMDEASVQHGFWLLESNGFGEFADDIREMYQE